MILVRRVYYFTRLAFANRYYSISTLLIEYSTAQRFSKAFANISRIFSLSLCYFSLDRPKRADNLAVIAIVSELRASRVNLFVHLNGYNQLAACACTAQTLLIATCNQLQSLVYLPVCVHKAFDACMPVHYASRQPLNIMLICSLYVFTF